MRRFVSCNVGREDQFDESWVKPIVGVRYLKKAISNSKPHILQETEFPSVYKNAQGENLEEAYRRFPGHLVMHCFLILLLIWMIVQVGNQVIHNSLEQKRNLIPDILEGINLPVSVNQT